MRCVAIVGCAMVVGVALGAPPAFHNAVASDDPILWYRFDESAGTTCENYGSLGGAFDGIYKNGVSLNAPSVIGDGAACYSVQFEQHVEALTPAPQSLLGNPSFTAEAVVRIFPQQPATLWAPFLHWGLAGTGNSVYFSLSNNDEDKAYAGFYNAGLRMAGDYDLGEWHHIVWVRDSNGGTNDSLTGTTMYVDGELAQLEPDPALCCNGVVPNVQAGPIRVQRADDFFRYFNGDIDEIVLYADLLTSDDVKAHYEALAADAPCPADCDANGVLNILDFVCFQTKFAAGDPAADCNRVTCLQLNVLDFVCYQQQFQAGCP